MPAKKTATKTKRKAAKPRKTNGVKRRSKPKPKAPTRIDLAPKDQALLEQLLGHASDTKATIVDLTIKIMAAEEKRRELWEELKSAEATFQQHADRIAGRMGIMPSEIDGWTLITEESPMHLRRK